jgi:chromosome partitioning protein
MRTLAIASLKGGVGKTTLMCALTIGLARRLPKNGRRRLLAIDCDPQGNASLSLLNGESPADPTLRHVLLAQAPIKAAVRPSRYPGVDMIPADTSLAECTVLLSESIGRETRLRSALEGLGNAYDVCLIDSPPGLSLVSMNAMTCANELLVPIDCSVYAAAGLARLTETVEQIRRYMSHPLQIIGLCLMKVQRSKVCRDFERQLRHHYDGLVYKTTVPYAAVVEEACSRNLTVGEYAPASKAAVAFDRLVKELTDGQRFGSAKRNPGTHRGAARGKRRAG